MGSATGSYRLGGFCHAGRRVPAGRLRQRLVRRPAPHAVLQSVRRRW